MGNNKPNSQRRPVLRRLTSFSMSLALFPGNRDEAFLSWIRMSKSKNNGMERLLALWLLTLCTALCSLRFWKCSSQPASARVEMNSDLRDLMNPNPVIEDGFSPAQPVLKLSSVMLRCRIRPMLPPCTTVDVCPSPMDRTLCRVRRWFEKQWRSVIFTWKKN